jgi:hypothetical protein
VLSIPASQIGEFLYHSTFRVKEALADKPSSSSISTDIRRRSCLAAREDKMAEKPLGFGYQVGAGAIAGVSEVKWEFVIDE